MLAEEVVQISQILEIIQSLGHEEFVTDSLQCVRESEESKIIPKFESLVMITFKKALLKKVTTIKNIKRTWSK